MLGVRMGFGVFGVWVAMTMDWSGYHFFVIRYRSGSGSIECDEKYGMF